MYIQGFIQQSDIRLEYILAGPFTGDVGSHVGMPAIGYPPDYWTMEQQLGSRGLGV